MSLTYTSYVADLANLMVVSSSDPNYVTVLPNIIDDAEQRIYRELDLLETVAVFSTGTVSSNTRTYTLPSSVTCVVINSLSAVDASGSRTPLIAATKEYIDTVYPTATSSSSAAVPIYFGMITDQTVVLGPPPGSTVSIEATVTTRPTPLSSANTSTYLTQYLPDLFLAASMVFANAYLKNWSASGDDPQAPVTWEKHYQTLKMSAEVEEFRKKFGSQGWTSKQPNPLATPPRA